MDILLLRFDAPLISFGAHIVDKLGFVQPWPAMSMVCGLVANALGYHHRDIHALQRLQQRLRYASRRDKRGHRITDFQTVDLGTSYMNDDLGWTTRGQIERRAGGSSKGTHIRLRDYWVDAVYTLALTLDPPDEAPDCDMVAASLDRPARPLFLGRKPCLPAGPVLIGMVQGDSLLEALKRAPQPVGVACDPTPLACWEVDDPDSACIPSPLPVTDARDWANQVHVGERWISSGPIQLTLGEDENAYSRSAK